ncbi:MAG: Arylesterase precursor [Burkholderiaceae bacterium]|nr:MAG: Arylesterase precursor [Burkholderiaceae bacterium]
MIRRHFILLGCLLTQAARSAQPTPTAAPSKAGAKPKTILVLGDSLSAEYGLARGTGWVALLQKRLAADRIAATVQNASISGETTAGGLSRLPTLLERDKPAIVVIELGANDALRGLSLAATRDNLSRMTLLAERAGAKVLLLGMQVPPNYGGDYTRRFAALYGEVARADHAALVPFFLAGVADAPNAAELFQSDRIHPTAAAHPTLLANVWPELRKLLR